MKIPKLSQKKSQASVSTHRRSVVVGSGALASSVLLQACGSSKPPKPPAPTPVAGSPSIGRVAWSFNAGAMSAQKNSPPVNFAPVFAAGSIWCAAADGWVSRVDARNGASVWRINVGKSLVAGVGTDSETAVVAARDGTLIGLDADGKTRWAVQNASEAMSVPAVGLGIAVARFSDNRIYGFDSETGKRRWQVQRTSPALVLRQTNSMAIDTAAVYVGMPGGRLLAISVKTGAVRWEAAVSQAKGANEIERIADVVGTPLLSGRELCAATYQGKLACFDAATGRTLWARDLPAKSGIEIDNRIVCAVDDAGNVVAFSRSGTVLWRQTKLAQRSLSAPISVDGHLLVGDEDGFIYVLSRDNGDIVGRVATDGSAILAAPCAADKLAVFQTSRGGIYAVSLG
jgi:outer membrane protein assembly factor BamB